MSARRFGIDGGDGRFHLWLHEWQVNGLEYSECDTVNPMLISNPLYKVLVQLSATPKQCSVN